MLSVSLGGCSDSSERGTGDGGSFERFPGWPDNVLVRKIGSATSTSITKLDIDDRGRIWVLRNDLDGSYTPTPLLERYGEDGALEQQLTFPAGADVSEFVIHPSGRLSVLVLIPLPDAKQGCAYSRCPLSVVEVSPEGDAAAPVALDNPQGEFSRTQGPRIFALADGEGLYLLASTLGLTPGVNLYRLGEDHTPRWIDEVIPVYGAMVLNFAPEPLARDERGNVYVGYQIFKDDVAIYNEHFHRPPLTATGIYDVLVEGFDPAGGFLGARLFGGPGANWPVSMTVHDGRVSVAGAARLTKYSPASSPNRTMEWDLFVASGHLTDTAIDRYTAIDLRRDDWIAQVMERADGSVVAVGRTDYVQVDTNSEVEDGKGLVVALSPELSVTQEITLSGPRDVQIQDAKLRADGSLVFAGIRNGPLTHTDVSQRNNDGVLGILTF